LFSLESGKVDNVKRHEISHLPQWMLKPGSNHVSANIINLLTDEHVKKKPKQNQTCFSGYLCSLVKKKKKNHYLEKIVA